MKKIIVILIAMLATIGLVAQNGNIARYLKIDKGNGNYETLNLYNGVSYSIKTEYNIDNKLVINIYVGDNFLAVTYPASVKIYPMYDYVLINGVKWATRNVDMPNTFAAKPEDAGMFYQWNRTLGWSSTDPMENSNGGTTWFGTNPSGTTWEAANDPSPAGYRVPTSEELESLLDENHVTNVWTTENGVAGRQFTDIATGNSIFLPAAGFRFSDYGTLYSAGTSGFYWSSTEDNTNLAYDLFFNNGRAEWTYDFKSDGFSVRPVAE